jgi:predicted HTH transcriptional regulator
MTFYADIEAPSSADDNGVNKGRANAIMKDAVNNSIKGANVTESGIKGSVKGSAKGSVKGRVKGSVKGRIDARINATQYSILKLLSANPDMRATEISGKLGIHERSVRKNLKYLKDIGYIERVGSDKTGYWAVKPPENSA